MARFIVRRLLWMIPSILVVTFLVYVACRIGFNPVASYSRANPRASQAKVDEFIQENGLYPGFKGYIKGYFEWLGKFLQGPHAWPKSIQGNGEVWEPLRYSFFNTLRLAGTGWATVELDRAEDELGMWLGDGAGDAGGVPPDATDPHLGAFARVRPAGGLPGDSFVLLEPAGARGRLEATCLRAG